MVRQPIAWLMVAVSAPATAALDPALVGLWQAGNGGDAVRFEVQADGRCTMAGRAGQCATLGSMLVFQSPALTLGYQWVSDGRQLQLSRGDAGSVVTFQRAVAATTAAAPTAAAPSPPAPAAGPAPPGAAPTPAAGPVANARPNLVRDSWGLAFSVPPAWRAVDKDGRLLVVSDTEAGLMVVSFVPRASREELLAGYREGLSDTGFVARPVVEASAFDAPGGPALAGTMEGRAQDGTTIRVRALAVQSRFGGALVVHALTTPPQFAALQARAESMARSVVFQAPPKAAPIAGHYQYVYVAKVGSYSREATLTLCASGRFQRSGEMAGSGQAGSAWAGNTGGGSWTAVGDDNGGTVTLQFAGGGSASLPYRVSTHPRDRSAYGPAVQFGNDLFQKNGPGNC